MTQGVHDIVAKLREQRSREAALLEEAQSKADLHKQQLARLDAALQALQVQDGAKQKRRQAKPAPTKQLVAEIVLDLRKQTPHLPEADLRSRLWQEVTRRGFSKMGLERRFQEVSSAGPHPST